jgi:hypothetical protein
LKYVLPKIGRAKDINSALQPNQELEEGKDPGQPVYGYFINDRKYLVGDTLKFSFSLAHENELFDVKKDEIKAKTPSVYVYNEQLFEHCGSSLDPDDPASGCTTNCDCSCIAKSSDNRGVTDKCFNPNAPLCYVSDKCPGAVLVGDNYEKSCIAAGDTVAIGCQGYQSTVNRRRL